MRSASLSLSVCCSALCSFFILVLKLNSCNHCHQSQVTWGAIQDWVILWAFFNRPTGIIVAATEESKCFLFFFLFIFLFNLCNFVQVIYLDPIFLMHIFWICWQITLKPPDWVFILFDFLETQLFLHFLPFYWGCLLVCLFKTQSQAVSHTVTLNHKEQRNRHEKYFKIKIIHPSMWKVWSEWVICFKD